MSLAQRSKFHVLVIESRNSTFENHPSKCRLGTSGLNFNLGLTGVKTVNKLAYSHPKEKGQFQIRVKISANMHKNVINVLYVTKINVINHIDFMIVYMI